MGEFLAVGMYFGAAVGFVHACQIVMARLRSGLGFLSTVWLALVFWALWSFFGAYVLALWVVGLAVMTAGKVLKLRRRHG